MASQKIVALLRAAKISAYIREADGVVVIHHSKKDTEKVDVLLGIKKAEQPA